MTKEAIAVGLYRHYKGTVYRVIGTGLHTETEEPLVLYYQHDDVSKKFARPAAMFDEMVNYNGQTVRRFSLIATQDFKGDGDE